MTTLGEVVQIFDGPHATPTRRSEGPIFLNISSLRSGRLHLAESDHVSEADFDRWTKRVQPEGGDLLFSYETRLGEAALMPAGLRACLGRRMGLLRPNRTVVEPRYLLYYYLSPEFQELIREREIHGATVPRILISEMGDWPLTLPDLRTQAAIAEVLGSLDDKIAANERVIYQALSLADASFQWAAEDAATELTTYGRVAEAFGGGTPSTSVLDYWDGPISWATPTDVTGLAAPFLSRTARTLTEEGFGACSSALHPAGSILMTSRATIGAFALAQTPVAVNQGFIVARPKDPLANNWLFFEMQSRVGDYVAHANGATFLELSRSTFKGLDTAWPTDRSTFERFNRDVEPLLQLSAAVDRENRTLAEMRDALLPALMSGELLVGDVAEVSGL